MVIAVLRKADGTPATMIAEDHCEAFVFTITSLRLSLLYCWRRTVCQVDLVDGRVAGRLWPWSTGPLSPGDGRSRGKQPVPPISSHVEQRRRRLVRLPCLGLPHGLGAAHQKDSI